MQSHDVMKFEMERKKNNEKKNNSKQITRNTIYQTEYPN